ncbi:MAG: N-acetylmuramoyl-L-alanine amidase [Gaiella sp.]
MRRLALFTAFVALVVAPEHALGGPATIARHDGPTPGARSLASSSRPFQLVGVHWRGPGAVDVRWRGRAGWSDWLRVAEDDDGAPPAGWRIGVPTWVGSASAVQTRRVGRVTRVRTFTVRSSIVRVPLRAVAAAGAPALVSRAAWLADESIRKGEPDVAPVLRMASVHHTAGTNSYTRAQAPAVVRAIQLYHVKANGWNDIGYNALVDRFGTVYEGRHGGVEANVVGAHARGFNTGSFGIAVMGDFRTVDPPAEALDALVRTLAWRLDLAHVDPLGTFNGISSGNERFNPGVPVFLRAISGHRDTGLTTCPGERLYGQIPDLARKVAARGLPKLYAPSLDRDEAGGTRFTARVSSALPWTVTVTDEAGIELDRGEGRGTTIDWVTSASIPAGARWRIETPGATPATGVLPLELSGTLSLGSTSVSEPVVSPNADGWADTSELRFTLSIAANVSAVVIDEAGIQVAELEAPRWRRAGVRTLAFDGLGLPDGRYRVRIAARASGDRSAELELPVAVSRTLGRVSLAGATVVPGRRPLELRYTLAAPAQVKLTLLREGRWVETAFDDALEAGPQTLSWAGSRGGGPARDGLYTVRVEVTDAIVTTRVELPFTLDGTAPVLRIFSVSPPRLWVSEPAVVTLLVNNARRRIEVGQRGPFTIPRVKRISTLVGTARDALGNASPQLRRR